MQIQTLTQTQKTQSDDWLNKFWANIKMWHFIKGKNIILM